VRSGPPVSTGFQRGQSPAAAVFKLIQNQEVEAGDQVCRSPLPFGAGFGVQLFQQIDDIEEPSAPTIPDADAGDADGTPVGDAVHRLKMDKAAFLGTGSGVPPLGVITGASIYGVTETALNTASPTPVIARLWCGS